MFSVDPDLHFGQNWGSTGGSVSQKNTVNVSTNNESGYSLRVSLSGHTAT